MLPYQLHLSPLACWGCLATKGCPVQWQTLEAPCLLCWHRHSPAVPLPLSLSCHSTGRCRKGQLKNDGPGCTPVTCMCLSLTHVGMDTQCSFAQVITLPISAYSIPLSVDSGQFLIVGSLFISWLLSGFCHFVWLKQWKLTACLLSDL